jgi:hypothetical protein
MSLRSLLLVVLALGCAKPVGDEPTQPVPATQVEPVTVTTSAPPRAPRPATAPAITPAVNGPSVRCRKACEPVHQLGCKLASECERSCREMLSLPSCQPEISAFFSCLSGHGVERWECLEDGTGAIRDGYCEREQAGFAACLEKDHVQ